MGHGILSVTNPRTSLNSRFLRGAPVDIMKCLPASKTRNNPGSKRDPARGRALLLGFQWDRADQHENSHGKNGNYRRRNWRLSFRPEMPVGEGD